jgi:hypothetical protein
MRRPDPSISVPRRGIERKISSDWKIFRADLYEE